MWAGWGIAENRSYPYSAILTRTVAYNIPEILSSRKVRDGLLVGSVVLLGVVSFGLGRLSAAPGGPGVALCEAPELQEASVLQAVVANPGTGQGSASSPTTRSTQGTYVASKSGSAYHFPWCSGAQRIKEENKVWFATKEEAEAAGYRPASNCKGL